MTQSDRYQRQIKLPHIGTDGQSRLSDARILIVGLGGLGSSAAMYLAAGGVGKLILNDFDCVETSNLHRQVIHRTDQIGELKTVSAKRMLRDLNPDCWVSTIDYQLEEDELRDKVDQVDLVVDCSDNFATRFALNRASVKARTPLVFGAAIRLEGQLACFNSSATSPCYACIYDEETSIQDDCESAGVLGPVPGVVGSMQALAAMLVLTGNTSELENKLLLFDALTLQWQSIKISRKVACRVCGNL